MRELRSQITVLFTREGSLVTAYAPSLELATCGHTVEHAKQMFQEAFEIFIEECVKLGTFEQVMGELGWKKSGRPARWQPPKFIKTENVPVRLPPAHV